MCSLLMVSLKRNPEIFVSKIILSCAAAGFFISHFVSFRFVLFGFSIVLIYISYLVYFLSIAYMCVCGFWLLACFYLSDKTFAVNVDFQLNAIFCSIIGAAMHIHSYFLLMPKNLMQKILVPSIDRK